MLRFEIASKQAGEAPGSIRIGFNGHLTFAFLPQFNREINNWILKGVNEIELDFRGITYLDSPGIGAVVAASELCQSLGGSMKILNARKLVHHLFLSARLEKQLSFGVLQEDTTGSSVRSEVVVPLRRSFAA